MSDDYSGLQKMKGQTSVLHIRLNPEDMMGCIDLVQSAGVPTNGMSLAMVARLALSACLQAARENGTIPSRDGFEYSAMIAPFAQANQAKKLQVTSIMRNNEISRMAMDKPATAAHVTITQPRELPPELMRKKGRLLTRALELQTKLDADIDNFTEQESEQLALINDAIERIDKGQDVDLKILLDN